MFFVLGPLWFVIVASALYYLFSRRRAAAMRPLPSFWVSYPGMTPPLGLLMRLFGQDNLRLRRDAAAESLAGSELPLREEIGQKRRVVEHLVVPTESRVFVPQAMKRVRIGRDDASEPAPCEGRYVAPG